MTVASAPSDADQGGDFGPARPLAEEQHAAHHADHRDDQHAEENTLTGTEVASLIQAQCAKANAMNTL